MKFIEKLVLNIYSIIMLVISLVLCLLIFGWVDIGVIGDMISKLLLNSVYSNVILVISVIFILLSLVCIFFGSSSKENNKDKQGVLLQNENGKLMISKETLENLVNSVALNFEGTEQVTTRVELDRENNVMVYVNLMVSSNVIIKELSANLQTKIKEKIKTATDLDVKEVNITVKKVAPKEEQQEA